MVNRSAFDNLRNLEKSAIGLWRRRHHQCAINGGSDDIGSQILTSRVDRTAQNLTYLRHWRDVFGVKLIQLSDVTEDRIEIVLHPWLFFWSQFQVRQLRHTSHIFYRHTQPLAHP